MLPPGTGRGQAKGINSTENNYGKEEDNIRQFYTWCHRMYDGGRNINACRTTERSAIAFLYRLVDCLYGLSVSQVLPIQTKAEKPHPFHFLRIVSDHCCGSGIILSVSSAYGFRNRQNE